MARGAGTDARIRWDEGTRAYLHHRTADGMSKREIIRCLKRYVARELHRHIRPLTPDQLASVA
ncbi:hypothetical protein [Kitasatospora aureofaciens]|uniref:hypothetical protein n=1 Tax=Kitasatospora aureofaciens TaxID=1894 RepID=UPI003F4CE44B